VRGDRDVVGLSLSLSSRVGDMWGREGGEGDNDDNCGLGSCVVLILSKGDDEGGGTSSVVVLIEPHRV
jgi:hypothetical protein